MSEIGKAFERELTSDEGYPLVDEPGPGVLEIRLWLVDAEVARMDSFFPETTRLDDRTGYEASMTLVIELVDSETDLLLLWARDRRPAPVGLRGSDRGSLLTRGRLLSARWAAEVRKGLGGPPAAATPPDRAP